MMEINPIYDMVIYHRKAVILSDEMRYCKLLSTLQTSIRHYIPLNQMKILAPIQAPVVTSGVSGVVSHPFNYLSLYQLVSIIYVM